VTDLFPPYGGYPKFVKEGLNEDWLPVWLQEAGYNTYYVGKVCIDGYKVPHGSGIADPFTLLFCSCSMLTMSTITTLHT